MVRVVPRKAVIYVRPGRLRQSRWCASRAARSEGSALDAERAENAEYAATSSVAALLRMTMGAALLGTTVGASLDDALRSLSLTRSIPRTSTNRQSDASRRRS